MTNKVSFLFIAQDQYSAVAKKVAASTQAVRDKFSFMAGVAQGVGQELSAMSDKLATAGKNIRNVGKDVSLYFSGPAMALAGVAIANFDKQAQALAQVEAALASTGGAAGKSLRELADEASALQERTLFGDEDILREATGTLLQFTNLAGKEFSRAQEAALDMAQRTGKGMREMSLVLGKALDVPAEGLSALSRIGVKFTDDEEQLIKALSQVGMKAQAQGLILSKVEERFKGAAAAAAAAGAGPLKQLSMALGDATEEIGGMLMEMLAPLITWLKELVIWFTNTSPAVKKVIAVALVLATVVGPLIIGFGIFVSLIPMLVAGMSALGAAFAFMTGPIGLTIAAIAAVVAGVIYLYDKFEIVRDIVSLVGMAFSGWWEILKLVFGGLQAIAIPVLDAITAAVKPLVNMLLGAMKIIDRLYGAAKAGVGFVKGAVEEAAVKTAQIVTGDINATSSSRTDVNVNLRAPQGAVESVKTRTAGNVPGMNVGVNMVSA